MSCLLEKIKMLQASGFRLQAWLAICFMACSMWLVACSDFAFAQEKPSSGELIVKSWEAHGKKDVEATFKYTSN